MKVGLERGHELRGRVEDSQDEPVAKPYVPLKYPRADGQGRRRTETDGEGWFHVIDNRLADAQKFFLRVISLKMTFENSVTVHVKLQEKQARRFILPIVNVPLPVLF